MSSQERWFTALWPMVQRYLPSPPATVVELGCGRFGGFVPRLLQSGYEALGIDPAAPDGESYRRLEFEQSALPPQLDAVLACTSLHHVADPRAVVGKMADALAPTGVVIIVEWDWESFDEATADWCFERAESDSWLERRRDGWRASGEPWEQYFRAWAGEHGIHGVSELLSELDARFQRVACERGPFYFADLADTTEADELEAISSGTVRAARIDYVGRL